MDQAREIVLDLERKFWTESGNPHFFAETMDDAGLAVIEPMGFVDKDQALKMNEQAESWTDLRMSDVHVVELTPDCVAVAYHGEAKQAKSGKPYRGSICSVYVRKNGRWKMGVTSHQPWEPKSEPENRIRKPEA